MTTVRRWYVFLVSGISLNAVVWAIIALLRNLFIAGLNTPRTQIAFEIAVIVIGMPFFLTHWLWTQRQASAALEERASVLRQFYLYGMMAGFLAPFLANAIDGIETVFSQLVGTYRPGSLIHDLKASEAVVYHLVAMLILALFWEYHRRQVNADRLRFTASEVQANPRRLSIYGFSATGLIIVTYTVINVIRWLSFQFGDLTLPDAGISSTSIHQLLIGLPLWLIYWIWGQRLFEDASTAEQESSLRKLYIYLAIFSGVIMTVVNATLILASAFRKLLDLPSLGDIRQPLPFIVVGAVLWSYHSLVLRQDSLAVDELPRQASIRRLYFYLLAGIGLIAMLIGLAGTLSVLIRSLSGQPFVTAIREQLAWFAAALIAGLPVWVWSWRNSLLAARRIDSSGESERQSIVRRIYLYFFLFVAAITLLSSGIYIVSQLIELALAARTPRFLLADLAQAIAFAAIAALVWFYHMTTLRDDGRYLAQAESDQLRDLRVIFVDQGVPGLASDVLARLRAEIAQISVKTIQISAVESATATDLDALHQADVIAGPWTMISEQQVGESWANAIARSPARKLLIPVRDADWDWVGVKRESAGRTTKQLAHALKQIAAGEEITPTSSLGIGPILAIIIGVLILLSVLMPLVAFLVEQLF